MPGDWQREATRRGFLRASALTGAALTLPGCLVEDESAREGPASNAGGEERLPPTPACDDGDAAEPTAAQTEGPFFTPDSPRRTRLREAGVAGAPLLLTGRVLYTDCRPVPGALLDFWQADGEGAYDNEGFRLRGHQLSARDGRYRLETVVPGEYATRTPHVHLKVQGRGLPPLATQLYLPGEPANERDGLFDPALLVRARPAGAGLRAAFDIVLAVD